MKRAIFVLVFILAYALTGCNTALIHNDRSTNSLTSEGTIKESQSNESHVLPSANADGAFSLPNDLPTTLATSNDIDDDGNGGYLLIGEVPEEDIALYCDNSKERNQAYIRYGEHFQAFDQEVWSDPTVLPEVAWKDWGEDGTTDLVVKYLRHEGTYFDGETTSPGLVCEEVVYQWDGEEWVDVHFYSSGPLEQG